MRQAWKSFVTAGPHRFTSPFWLIAGALSLSYAWLLPNYGLPWTSFHRDTWAAINLLIAAAVIVARYRGTMPWHPLAWLIAVLVPIPLLQYAGGLIVLAGTAWINTAFLLGLLVAMLFAAAWARKSPTELVDGLFLAIGVAATIGVAYGLMQWLNMSALGIWIFATPEDRRIYANLGQPNQFGTFLLWGLAAGAWAYVRGRLRTPFLVAWALLMLLGIALTQSRTAWVGLAVVAACVWHWRHLWPSRRLAWLLLGLLFYFAVICVGLEPAARALYLGDTLRVSEKFVTELRPAIWKAMFDASLQRPWLGYGWGQVMLAQVNVALEHPEIRGLLIGHSHNLVLDLAIYLGWPLAGVCVVTMLWWFVRQFRNVATAADAVLVLFVTVTGIHAMTELPLHYGYILFPLGVVIGTLNTRNGGGRAVEVSRHVFTALFATAVLLTVALVRDYLIVESNYTSLRVERARIGKLPPEPVPDLWLLSNLHQLLYVARMPIKPGMQEADIQAFLDVATTYSSAPNMMALAQVLALNGREAEAKYWLARVCLMDNTDECKLIRRGWAYSGKEWPQLLKLSVP